MEVSDEWWDVAYDSIGKIDGREVEWTVARKACKEKCSAGPNREQREREGGEGQVRWVEGETEGE